MGSTSLVALSGNLLQAKAAPPSSDEPDALQQYPERGNHELQDPQERRLEARRVRLRAANIAFELPIPPHPNNGDEELYPNRIANFHKGLPCNFLGEVNPTAYDIYLAALNSGKQADFEQIPLAGTLKLVNPMAGLMFELIGGDSHAFFYPPAPRFNSTEEAADMVENYWMALLRDIPFSQYNTSPLAQIAIQDLNRLSNFKGPKVDGVVNSNTLFRGPVPGCLNGPYISQFLFLDVPYGVQPFSQRNLITTPGVDFVTSYEDWLAIQRGNVPEPTGFEATRRYLRSGRDLGELVHNDVLFQLYLNAALILMGLKAPWDPGNPYVGSRTMDGFGTFGQPYFTSMLGVLVTRALETIWFQKWFVHRRLRPECYAGRVHNVLTGRADYPVNAETLDSEAVRAVFRKYGTYLLPLAYPEGCPAHPSFGGGHATVAGACVTFLKAFFDENFVIPNPVIPNNSGLELLPYSGAPLTVGGELNKLAANAGLGRDFAGVHWRSDLSLERGEAVAIQVLREMRESGCYSEDFAGFSLTKFNGSTIIV